jgi:hypothetical protein
MPPKVMVRALFVVAMVALVVDLLTSRWYLGMIAAGLAWAGFVLLYRLKLRRDDQRPARPD